jgi:hypothetical protein
MQIDNGVRHNFAYVSGPLSLWGRLLYFCSKAQKYIAIVPIGYNTDLVMFFQISRTLQRKRHAKRTFRAPRNGPTTSAPQYLPCIKMALAWLLFRITLLFFVLDCPPWPQTGLVYIDLELVIHLQLPPKIWAPKMPNISQKWRKSINYRHNNK